MSRHDLLERARLLTLVGLGIVLVGATVAASPAPAVPSTGSEPGAPVLHARLDARPPHITLDASTPGDEESIDGDVTEVRLFFSEPPLMRGASIRIVDSSRKLVRSSPPEPDAEDPSQLAVQLSTPLAAGQYVVQWRCIADDGHVMRGSFTFDVAGR